MNKKTLIVIDDHQLVREMCLHLFSNHQTIEVIGDSGVFEEAIELVKAKRPDVVLLDINLSNASGFDAVPLIRKYSPATKIIAVSLHNQPAYAKKMMQLGARGYVTKNSSRQEIFKAIEEACNGRTYVCSEIKNILSEQMLSTETKTPSLKDLSLREIEIIKLIREGLSSKEIATSLWISVKTVEVHRYNILKKLNLKNSASLVNFIYNYHGGDLLVA